MTAPDPRQAEPGPGERPSEPSEGGQGPAIEGADAAALGLGPAPESAPEAASVDDAEHRVPGAAFERPVREAKPWFTSLAAESDQAGVGNEAPED